MSPSPVPPLPDGIVRLHSTLRCPFCGSTEELPMPENACVVLHTCICCGRKLRPEPGNCCVFCSYGNVPCPPIQQHGHCGGESAE